jgi:hypothetical protein
VAHCLRNSISLSSSRRRILRWRISTGRRLWVLGHQNTVCIFRSANDSLTSSNSHPLVVIHDFIKTLSIFNVFAYLHFSMLSSSIVYITTHSSFPLLIALYCLHTSFSSLAPHFSLGINYNPKCTSMILTVVFPPIASLGCGHDISSCIT